MPFFGQMPLASDPRRSHASIIDMRNSLNINFTGIHALEHLFSVKFNEKWDQDEISRTILKILLLIGNLVFVWGSVLHQWRATQARLRFRHSIMHGMAFFSWNNLHSLAVGIFLRQITILDTLLIFLFIWNKKIKIHYLIENF